MDADKHPHGSAYYPKKKKLVVINNSDTAQTTKVTGASGKVHFIKLEPHGISIQVA